MPEDRGSQQPCEKNVVAELAKSFGASRIPASKFPKALAASATINAALAASATINAKSLIGLGTGA